MVMNLFLVVTWSLNLSHRKIKNWKKTNEKFSRFSVKIDSLIPEEIPGGVLWGHACHINTPERESSVFREERCQYTPGTDLASNSK